MHPENCQTSKMNFHLEIAGDWIPLAASAKSSLSDP